MTAVNQARVIVIGNEKGGSGKSTTAMHLIVALLRQGHRVASIDLDRRQRTLSRYVENRNAYAAREGKKLPVPHHAVLDGPGWVGEEEAAEEALGTLLGQLRAKFGAIVIDTPGSDNSLGRVGHTHADVLVTPLNDSFVDLDVLARVDAATMEIAGPSHYAEMVWERKKKRLAAGGGSIDWIVMRNRLSSLDAHSKRHMARLLDDLSKRIGFRIVPGFGERVVYRELFHKGLTMMDLRQVAGEEDFNLSHVAARQEVRMLVEAVGIR